jgi:hypothetical protein
MMQSNISEGLMHDIISHSISETDGTPCSHWKYFFTLRNVDVI